MERDVKIVGAKTFTIPIYKMNVTVKSLVVISILFLTGVFLLDHFKKNVTLLELKNTANRRVSSVCLALSKGNVSQDELCSTSIPEIPYFHEGYYRVKVQDERWFSEKGWSYYPQVSCGGGKLTLGFMGRHFDCNGAEAELVSGDFSTIFPGGRPGGKPGEALTAADSETKQCYERGTLRRKQMVVSVEADGTIVLDSNEQLILQGVKFPENKPNKKGAEKCLDSTVQYIKGQVQNRPIFVYQSKDRRFDDKRRFWSYVVTERGTLLNLELIRYGMAVPVETTEGAEADNCAEKYLELEKISRKRQLGLWDLGCFDDRQVIEKAPDAAPEVIKIVPTKERWPKNRFN